MGLLLTHRYLLALAGATGLSALLIGIPTDVIPNPWFQRMTPVRTLDVVLLPILSLAIGALLATYALPAGRRSPGLSNGAGAGLLGAFAVGCPVCNKLVVMALGYSGALTYFAPVQPALGLGALAITLLALRLRLSALSRGCSLDPHAAARVAP